MAFVTTLQGVGPGVISAGDTVLAAGEFVVFGGGQISDTIITNPSFSNFPATLSAGAFVNSGGIASGTTVLGGGEQVVDGGGAATNTVVLDGGTELVFSNGVTSAPQVLFGGVENIAVGGTAVGALVDGGVLNVGSGGKDIDATIGAGGPGGFSEGGVTVSAGGTDTGATVGPGGGLFVALGGTASHVTITGGVVEVAAGGTIDGVTVSGGPQFTGELVLESGVTVSGRVDLVHGGALILEADSNPGVDVKDFRGGDLIDFGSVKYFAVGAKATTAVWDQTTNAGGVLKVLEGNHSVANVHLVGQYVTAEFATQAGGFGGTDVVFNGPVSGNAAMGALAGPHH